MQTSNTLYEVEIAGLQLKLRSSHDEATVNQLIDLVNDKIQEALAAGPQVSFQRALLLASLHLAEDIMLLKRSAHTELDKIEGQAKKILTDLESSPISKIRIDS